MTKGPRRPSPGRPQSAPQPAASDLSPPLSFWVEGTGRVRSDEPERRREVYDLERRLAALGLHMHVSESPAPGASRPRRRRFSTHPVTLGALVAALVDAPAPLALEDLADLLHKVTPWTDQARAAAVHRTRVAVNRIRRDDPTAIRITHAEDGRRLLGPGPTAARFSAEHPD